MDKQLQDKIVEKLEEFCRGGAVDEDDERYVTYILSLRAEDRDSVDDDEYERLLEATSQVATESISWAARAASITAMMRFFGKEALPVILVGTTDPQTVVRQAAVTAIGCLDATEAYVSVEARRDDPDPFVRASARWTLQRLESDEGIQEAIVDEFQEFLDNTSASDFGRFNHYQNLD
jgi:HEAT repeat protein